MNTCTSIFIFVWFVVFSMLTGGIGYLAGHIRIASECQADESFTLLYQTYTCKLQPTK